VGVIGRTGERDELQAVGKRLCALRNYMCTIIACKYEVVEMNPIDPEVVETNGCKILTVVCENDENEHCISSTNLQA